jgi:cytochrome P450
MLHDEDTYPEPSKFDPNRFIKDGILRDDVPNPEVIATFGFGRR